MRRALLAGLIVFGVWALGNAAGAHDWATGHAARAGGSAAKTDARSVTIYKSPSCGCCSSYVAYLRHAGFQVQVVELEKMAPIKRMLGIGPALESCHTAAIDHYLVEGHVPIGDIKHLLAQRPDIRGIALPGMPQGVPGMPGPKPKNLTLYTIEKQPRAFPAQ